MLDVEELNFINFFFFNFFFFWNSAIDIVNCGVCFGQAKYGGVRRKNGCEKGKGQL